MKSDDLPSAQALSKAVAEDLLSLAKDRGDGAGSLLPALAPGSPLEKAMGDAFAPIREALEALNRRLDRLEEA
jgi:hypothetical protein